MIFFFTILDDKCDKFATKNTFSSVHNTLSSIKQLSDGNIAVAVVDYLCCGVHKVNLPGLEISCFVTAMSWRCYVSNDDEEKVKGKEEDRWRRSQEERL